jgi:hypothetical protein
MSAAVHCFAWQIGGEGYDMVLSGQVPATIMAKLPINLEAILDGGKQENIQHWAIHPGGRTILDAVQKCLGLSGRTQFTSTDTHSNGRGVFRRRSFLKRLGMAGAAILPASASKKIEHTRRAAARRSNAVATSSELLPDFPNNETVMKKLLHFIYNLHHRDRDNFRCRERNGRRRAEKRTRCSASTSL